jgi:aspartate/methionine/tyrosine aminotransferase
MVTAGRGIYHISDEAYEYFTYDGAAHFSPGSLGGEDHTISLFSLSKAYGMASWRVGFLVAPEHLFDDLIKIQDTVIICAPAVSQAVALEALRIGRGYCKKHLEVIAGGVLLPGEGAHRDGRSQAYRTVDQGARVAVIPGGTFGITESCCLRIAYGSLKMETAVEGTRRLIEGLQAILGK